MVFKEVAKCKNGFKKNLTYRPNSSIYDLQIIKKYCFLFIEFEVSVRIYHEIPKTKRDFALGILYGHIFYDNQLFVSFG